MVFGLESNAGKVYRLYQAAFNRTPDATGLGYWIHAMYKGSTIQRVVVSSWACRMQSYVWDESERYNIGVPSRVFRILIRCSI
ncbi:DUF4214 domain-containing protein [Undibacterium sp. Ji83W]|uniref:DUF4214 domain-containing protein n=1 Tax=Undibacterium sp. Ji83W TaxID=3413043 RepID=UPI003BEFC137